MKDTLILKNKTSIELEPSSSLGKIKISCVDNDAMNEMLVSFTKENLEEVEIKNSNDVVIAKYKDLMFVDSSFVQRENDILVYVELKETGKIKFVDYDTIYSANVNIIYTKKNNKIIKVEFLNEVPTDDELTNGLLVMTNNGELVRGSFTDYKTVYRRNDNVVELSEGEVYVEPKLYLVYNDDNYVIATLLSDETHANTVLVDTEELDRISNDEFVLESGFYKYKVENGNVMETTKEERNAYIEHLEELEKIRKENEFKAAKESKLNEISSICEQMIVNGVDVRGKHYSYSLTEQNDIYNALQLSMSTGLDVPYHADNESCMLHSAEQLVEIYVSEQSNLTHHTTYHNQLKLYINTLTTIEEINAVVYGQELTGEYLETYNMMMQQAIMIINAFLSK